MGSLNRAGRILCVRPYFINCLGLFVLVLVLVLLVGGARWGLMKCDVSLQEKENHVKF